MSNFTQPTIHPNTGEIEDATWHDNYFGPHRYGVEFADGAIFPESAVKVPTQIKVQKFEGGSGGIVSIFTQGNDAARMSESICELSPILS